MSKKLVITGILMCDQCPHYYEQRMLCDNEKAFDIRKNESTGTGGYIPEWCPLPDEET